MILFLKIFFRNDIDEVVILKSILKKRDFII